MGTSDILILNRICKELLEVNLLEISMFNLCSIINTSEEISQVSQNILDKIIMLTVAVGKVEAVGGVQRKDDKGMVGVELNEDQCEEKCVELIGKFV